MLERLYILWKPLAILLISVISNKEGLITETEAGRYFSQSLYLKQNIYWIKESENIRIFLGYFLKICKTLGGF